MCEKKLAQGQQGKASALRWPVAKRIEAGDAGGRDDGRNLIKIETQVRELDDHNPSTVHQGQLELKYHDMEECVARLIICLSTIGMAGSRNV